MRGVTQEIWTMPADEFVRAVVLGAAVVVVLAFAVIVIGLAVVDIAVWLVEKQRR